MKELRVDKKLRNKIDEYDLSYTKSKVKFKISKINNTEYYNREYEFAKRNVETIKKVLNSMNVFYNDITYIICRNITVYFISSHYHFSYEAFGRNLKNYIHNFPKEKLNIEFNLGYVTDKLDKEALRIQIDRIYKELKEQYSKDEENKDSFLNDKYYKISVDLLDSIVSTNQIIEN